MINRELKANLYVIGEDEEEYLLVYRSFKPIWDRREYREKLEKLAYEKYNKLVGFNKIFKRVKNYEKLIQTLIEDLIEAVKLEFTTNRGFRFIQSYVTAVGRDHEDREILREMISRLAIQN